MQSSAIVKRSCIRTKARLWTLIGVIIACGAGGAAADQVVRVNADFNDTPFPANLTQVKPISKAPEAGQVITAPSAVRSVNTARVFVEKGLRDTTSADALGGDDDPVLVLRDTGKSYCLATFALADGQQQDAGTVTIELDLLIDGSGGEHDFFLALIDDEQRNLATIKVRASDGRLVYSRFHTPGGENTNHPVGSIEVGKAQHLKLLLDLDRDTLTMHCDNRLIASSLAKESTGDLPAEGRFHAFRVGTSTTGTVTLAIDNVVITTSSQIADDAS